MSDATKTQQAAVAVQSDADTAVISRLTGVNADLKNEAADLRARLSAAEKAHKDAVAQGNAEKAYYTKQREELDESMGARMKMLQLQADVASGKTIATTPGDGFSEKLLAMEEELLSAQAK